MNLTIDHVIDNNATVKFLTLSQVISLMSRSLLQERLDFSKTKKRQIQKTQPDQTKAHAPGTTKDITKKF